MNQWEQLLRLLALVSTAVLLVRIVWMRLYRRYPLFTGLLAVQLAQELILLPFASNRNLYALIFFISEQRRESSRRLVWNWNLIRRTSVEMSLDTARTSAYATIRQRVPPAQALEAEDEFERARR